MQQAPEANQAQPREVVTAVKGRFKLDVPLHSVSFNDGGGILSVSFSLNGTKRTMKVG